MEGEQEGTNYPFSRPDRLLQTFMPDLEAEPNQTVIEVNRTDSLMTVSHYLLSF